ncbi:ABC transporter permease [Pararhodobacter oceanensis]|uniref:ABC transporter permease n=1 Tax=Pararhodobacter oceanensis TaxID=2172121 RepID=UPI003A9202CB
MIIQHAPVVGTKNKKRPWIFYLPGWLLPASFFVFLIVLWQIVTMVGEVPSYVVPAPTDIWTAAVRNLQRGIYPPHLFATMQSVLIGYTTGVLSGIILGTIFAEVRVIERLVFPLVVALQSVPKVALAPLFVMWFGYGFTSKVITVTLLCLFPVLVNTVTGLKSADPDRVSLIKAMTGNRLQVFRYVKLPTAAGHILAAMQVSVVLALIGALVAEFVGSDRGLGILIQNGQLNLDTPGIFVILIILSLIGIISTSIVRFAQRKIVFWESGRDRPAGEN